MKPQGLLDLQSEGHHRGDHYYAEDNAVWLCFTGDGIFRFRISTSTIGKEGASAYAKELCEILNNRQPVERALEEDGG